MPLHRQPALYAGEHRRTSEAASPRECSNPRSVKATTVCVPRRRFLRALLLSLPFVYVLVDLLENGTVLRLLANYPERLVLLASGLPYVTMIKRAASLLALTVPVSLLAFQFLRTRSHEVETLS